MGVFIGKDCTVKIGANTVLGMGTFSLPILDSDELEATDFGDDFKSFKFGLRDGGTISFSGNCRVDDVTGQEVLTEAALNQTEMTDLRFYLDDDSYYVPAQTTGYFNPSITTTGPVPISYVNIKSFSIDADKGDLVKIAFEARVSGVLGLV